MNFSNLAKKGSGAYLNNQQYNEWYRKVRSHDELLEVLKEIVLELDKPNPFIMDEHLDKARSAIAKAEGRVQ